jgi:hypothetical protein
LLFEIDTSGRLFRMAKKKGAPKKKVDGNKNSSAKKSSKRAAPIKRKAAATKTTAVRGRIFGNKARTTEMKLPSKTARGAVKSTARKVRAITEEIHSPMKSSLGGDFGVEKQRPRRGTGAESGGQSGDTEGISREENVDSESVEELLEEGQSFEAEVVSGVENARNADQGEVRTHEVPEDDVPEEYEDKDRI